MHQKPCIAGASSGMENYIERMLKCIDYKREYFQIIMTFSIINCCFFIIWPKIKSVSLLYADYELFYNLFQPYHYLSKTLLGNNKVHFFPSIKFMLTKKFIKIETNKKRNLFSDL